jgi:hypothetical protein
MEQLRSLDSTKKPAARNSAPVAVLVKLDRLDRFFVSKLVYRTYRTYGPIQEYTELYFISLYKSMDSLDSLGRLLKMQGLKVSRLLVSVQA